MTFVVFAYNFEHWKTQDGQIVYEYMNTKPDFKPGYIHSGFIIH